ncbi:MAG: chorismate mutase [Candidatus Dactylopiibacterium carminicum]|uniref:Bifunctional chorismate mutase/prephenate dehydratase n=1 Tax=Candidatus Dactylopiibacterium carminicum TaxID=857335 RepID=A0A272ENL0_9RHOO|nr:prephenate dehydratase [Candidatus Dactylopiibacterium carminicum]KAF7598094.1 prephenate dehydratase [Candidatus Dactylopiibacterium carminicum]PAS91689.1 MAG: chorismate mutase [Candidatus Dactylopiibacterium carminicum]PAS93694.1 MAG: chorismate mutase [Candidatus Dactylopiibacterium carminicum]PAS96580.1 MAG: chorismate mutase [Candidatus Dactylopiibacterium carminicum]
MADELLKLRSEIDRLDGEILERLAARARCAQRVGEVKRGPLYRPEREAQVLRSIAERNTGPLSDEAVQRIFREIMSWCLGLEQPLKVAHLGPRGTFTEEAAGKHFGGSPALLPLATIEEIFHAVEAGAVEYGVVPVENSTEGAVSRSLDLLLSANVSVCGEVSLRIRQNLMTRATSLADIKRIYSHSQSLGQCADWLAHHAQGIERLPVSSNAEAARLASEDVEAAAIAGERAAQLYDLPVLFSNIEDDPNNTTRFLVVGRHDAGPSGRDKTSLVCSAPNRPGAVFGLLQPFSEQGVSMTKLESRPSRTGLWEYVFYVDIEGHRQDPAVAAALAALNERAAFVKVLGSYPVAAI